MKPQRDGQREKRKKREIGSSCRRPHPNVTRRDILEREERPVPKAPPVVARRSSRLLETILEDLNEARRERTLADAEMYEDELYPKLVSQYASADIMPTSVQEKYELLRDL